MESRNDIASLAQADLKKPVNIINSKLSGSSLVQAIHVPGVPGAPEKMKVVARQEEGPTRYVFVFESASTDTLVEVQLPGLRELVFKLISSEGSKIPKTFNMPFDIDPKRLLVNGTNVEYLFDWEDVI